MAFKSHAKGHRLTVEWNGERARGESASTGTCPCGWTESASSQREVRAEYRYHLDKVRERIEREKRS
jgi:hypothetical protein